jgi:hypothetical protein
VKEPREDDERLSALLEGRVEGRQREDLLAHLAEADDDYEVFANTAAVLRALEEEDARAGRGGMPRSMRKRGWPSVRTAATVFGAVMLLLAAGLVLRGRGAASGYSPLEVALRARPAANWSPWQPRGGQRGEDDRSTRDARAVKAGAMLVDLAVAIRSRNTTRTGETATLLIDGVKAGTRASAPLRQIEERPDQPVDSLNALVERATARLAEQLERGPLELGAWVEAARLAASAENAAFFVDGASDGMLARAKRVARGDQAALAAVESVRAALPRNGRANWPVLEDTLDKLLNELVT